MLFAILLVIIFSFNSIFGKHSTTLSTPKQAVDFFKANSQNFRPVCDASNSKNYFIFCYGRLLEAVNLHKLFNESKWFVYRPIRQYSAVRIKFLFEVEFPEPVTAINKTKLAEFIAKNFLPAGSDLVKVIPTDWKEKPEALVRIRNESLRIWAFTLNGLWKDLSRQVKTEVKDQEDRHSLIYLPKPFMVPSVSRFKELYYWDSYWIIKGLLASEMFESAKSIIENFIYLIDKYGFVPNGNRVYQLRRSQPPVLCLIVSDYLKATNDSNFVRQVLPYLEKEMEFWQTNRSVQVVIKNATYRMHRYAADSNTPWPEDYMNQIELARNISDESKRQTLFQQLAADAESGWDHSSRWMRIPKHLTTIETSNILAVDLNAFICGNLRIISELYGKIGKKQKSLKYLNLYKQFQSNYQKLFLNIWNNGTTQHAAWFDYNIRTKRHNTKFYASMAVPLFTHCYDSAYQNLLTNVYSYFKSLGVFEFPGGMPASLEDSGEQWDFPNGWAPTNHMFVEGMRNSENIEMKKMSFSLAEKWISTNFKVYQATGHMWEKYNVSGTIPAPGGGGKYKVEPGFGWSNGVVLDLLIKNTF